MIPINFRSDDEISASMINGYRMTRYGVLKNSMIQLKRVRWINFIIFSDGRVFVSHIGYSGVPARLSIVTNRKSEDSGPLLLPYPDWSWFSKSDCTGITSVYGIAVSLPSFFYYPV